MADIIKVFIGATVEKINVRVSDVISGAGASAVRSVTMTATAGISTFDVAIAAGSEILYVTRGGLSKGITETATTNTQLIQINDLTVTLPTGDITGSDPLEVFVFLYK